MKDHLRALDRIEEPDVITIRASYLQDSCIFLPPGKDGEVVSVSIIRDLSRRELAHNLVNQLIAAELIEFSENIQTTPMGSNIAYKATIKVKSPYHKITFIY